MNLGRVLLAREDYEGARDCFDRALENQTKTRGPDHPDLAYTLQSYGRMLRKAGDLDGARERLQRAVPILEAAFGPTHIDVGRVSYSLGLVEYQAGNLKESRRHLERALESYREVFGPDSAALAGPLYGFACVSALEGDRDRAIVELREAIDLGFANAAIFSDPDLDSLRGDPEFEALVQVVRARLGEG
jgi:tetratricopeptide (TPR) repeat protein